VGTARTLDRSPYEPDFDEEFDSGVLDRSRWLPHYLPHWAGLDASAARYDISDGVLALRIDADQPVWHPDVAPGMRVSNLQTGHRAGPVGGTVGQHRTDARLTVREHVPPATLYTPRHGLIEARVRALADPTCMVALWLIGLEERPEDSAEICVFEIFGRDVHPSEAHIGMGVKPHGDPRAEWDFERVRLDADATDWHVYSAEWADDAVHFYVDDRHVKTVPQSIRYPMQLMLNIYEFDAPAAPQAGDYPKVFPVDFVRGHRPRG
jgi:Glycosyl hydrolases family 16